MLVGTGRGAIKSRGSRRKRTGEWVLMGKGG